MNALIVSLNFNPGHFSHLIANYKLLEDVGYKPYLYVNEAFNKMDNAYLLDKDFIENKYYQFRGQQWERCF